MPRRKRGGSSSNSPTPWSGDPEELRGVVASILSRLEVLERVFVFVDFSQLNKLLAKQEQQAKAASSKAGLDDAFASSWMPLPASTSARHNDLQDSTAPAASSTAAVSTDALRVVSEAAVPTAPVESATGFVKHDDALPVALAELRELRRCEADEESELKSTCSTWDLCSTRSGWGEDIEPEVFERFMSQALRPRWGPGKSASSMPGRHEERPGNVLEHTETEHLVADALRPSKSSASRSRQIWGHLKPP